MEDKRELIDRNLRNCRNGAREQRTTSFTGALGGRTKKRRKKTGERNRNQNKESGRTKPRIRGPHLGNGLQEIGSSGARI